MRDETMSIDPVEYGKLSQQVKHLAEAQEEQNALLREHIEATGALTLSVNMLSTRLSRVEGSPFMQPAKLGKAALIGAALILLLAIKGVKETMEIIAKAVLP